MPKQYCKGITCITCGKCNKPLEVPQIFGEYFCPNCGKFVFELAENGNVTATGTCWGAESCLGEETVGVVSSITVTSGKWNPNMKWLG